MYVYFMSFHLNKKPILAPLFINLIKLGNFLLLQNIFPSYKITTFFLSHQKFFSYSKRFSRSIVLLDTEESMFKYFKTLILNYVIKRLISIKRKTIYSTTNWPDSFRLSVLIALNIFVQDLKSKHTK